ncbi:MAG: DUF2283 domain-containing protein [Chloroflexi bacterium]|nr:DUF2283 domain-containing protein [Chloroflexota bacterium]
MQVLYNSKTDTLYIRLDESKQDVINRRVSDDVVLDVGESDKIVGIEIVDASSHLNLKNILPVEFKLFTGVKA